MGENNGHNETAPPFYESQPVKAKCSGPGCTNFLELRKPQAYFLNDIAMSVVIVPHAEAIVCGECGAVYTIKINTIATKPIIDLVLLHAPQPRIIAPS